MITRQRSMAHRWPNWHGWPLHVPVVASHRQRRPPGRRIRHSPRLTRSRYNCFKFHRRFRLRPDFRFSQLASVSANGPSLLTPFLTGYFGWVTPLTRYFLIVLRESRFFLKSFESTDAHSHAIDELHSINPRLSLLSISFYLFSRNKGYT